MSVKTLETALPTLKNLCSHWLRVDLALKPNKAILGGGYDRAAFVADVDGLEETTREIQRRVKTRETAAGRLATDKDALKDRLQSFTRLVRGTLVDSEYARALPRLPLLESNEDLFMRPMEDALALWARINGAGSPLVLPDGTHREAFAAGIAVVKSSFRAREAALEEERKARRVREEKVGGLRKRAVQYRQVVLASFPANHMLVKDLPRLWPAQDRRKKPATESVL